MAWESWFQDLSASVVNKAADAKFVQPYEIDKLRMQALGELGMYQEGQPGAGGQIVKKPGLFGMSQEMTLLVLAGGVAFLMTRD